MLQKLWNVEFLSLYCDLIAQTMHCPILKLFPYFSSIQIKYFFFPPFLFGAFSDYLNVQASRTNLYFFASLNHPLIVSACVEQLTQGMTQESQLSHQALLQALLSSHHQFYHSTNASKCSRVVHYPSTCL